MTDAPKTNPLIELLVTLIIPSLILMKLSGPANLGAVNALLLALAFPLAWGALTTPRFAGSLSFIRISEGMISVTSSSISGLVLGASVMAGLFAFQS